MRCDRFTKATRLIAGLIIGLLFAITVVPLSAETAQFRHGQGFGPVYDATHEISVNGMVQEVVTNRTSGSPAGMHLMVSGANGLVDAHVGYFLTKNTRAALHTGLPVQMVGAMTTVHGKQFLLVRQLTYGGRTLIVRSRTGAPAHAVGSARSMSPRGVRAANYVAKAKGGAR